MSKEYRTESNLKFDELCDRVHKVVPENGFSILSEIRTSDILRSKGFEYPDLRTYDICNPGYAIKALSLGNLAETVIPCRMIVKNAGDHSEVSVQMPGRVLEDILSGENKDSVSFLPELENKLRNIVDLISK